MSLRDYLLGDCDMGCMGALETSDSFRDYAPAEEHLVDDSFMGALETSDSFMGDDEYATSPAVDAGRAAELAVLEKQNAPGTFWFEPATSSSPAGDPLANVASLKAAWASGPGAQTTERATASFAAADDSGTAIAVGAAAAVGLGLLLRGRRRRRRR